MNIYSSFIVLMLLFIDYTEATEKQFVCIGETCTYTWMICVGVYKTCVWNLQENLQGSRGGSFGAVY